MTKIGSIQFLLLFLISAAYGQKAKYKDIYALLSTKQFEQAEPFLKHYLRENTENPNAYLFMGNIFQEKAAKNDVLKQTSIAIANMDSAIYFYDQTYKILDDRELRKNKEYYEHYNRRDLRTGEFGVKLSDIQFDLEKRIESLKERIQKVGKVKRYFSLADSSYSKANALYTSLQQKYPTLNQLYLRADDQTVKDLTSLSVRFDSCTQAFNEYKSLSASLGKTGYNQKMSLADIKDFKRDGRNGADFYNDGIQLWDYKSFADESRAIIEKEIFPMRKHLVAYDMEINKLREKLRADSVSVRNDLIKLVDKLLDDQLRKFDAEPLPMLLFALKTADLEYRSTILEHKSLRDSSNVHLQLSILHKEMQFLRKLDSTASILSDAKLQQKAIDYSDFINSSYSNQSALNNYVRTLQKFALQQREKKAALADQYARALKYIVDGSDSIPLSSDILSTYRPLVITPEKYTTGLSLRDTTQLQGYFYTITSARRAEVKAYFPLDKSAFRPRNISAAHALAYSDADGQIFYVLLYSENPVKQKFPATLAKIHRSNGLAWKVDYPLAFTPSELIVSADTGDLVIRNGVEQMVVDKNGKLR